MQFLAICFAITLVVALIGPSNILTIIIIGIPLVIIALIILNKWSKKYDSERNSEEKEYQKQYFSTELYFKEGTSVRPPITGDYFDWKYDYRAIDYYYCRYANTSNCINCSRRKEHRINDQYYYGVSDNCKTYNNSDD